MIIYNVTVSVDEDVHREWLDWMQRVHIPDVMATGLFTGSRVLRVLTDQDTGVTYSIQYTCRNMGMLERYQEDHAPRLQEEHSSRYRDKFVAFRTLLEVVD